MGFVVTPAVATRHQLQITKMPHASRREAESCDQQGLKSSDRTVNELSSLNTIYFPLYIVIVAFRG